jgi:hypothetical protein
VYLYQRLLFPRFRLGCLSETQGVRRTGIVDNGSHDPT